MFLAQFGHNRAPIGPAGDQPHGGELAQRLADRCARNKKAVGQRQFVKLFARTELAGHNGIGQLPDNVIDCVALARQALLHRSGPNG